MATMIIPTLDASGNGNNWTGNNINYETVGSTYDLMTDVPTLTSATVANFATFNPLEITTTTKPTNGNLTFSPSSTSPEVAISTIAIPSSGKWYAEVTRASATSSHVAGIVGTSRSLTYVGDTGSIGYFETQIYKDASLVQSGLTAVQNGDTYGIAVDADAQTVQFYVNGVSSGSAVSYTYSQVWFACGNYVSGQVYQANFGQRPFAYTPPTGYVALNTYNLPTPTIGATASSQANKYMDATLWSGNASSGRAITNSGGFAPALVWVKQRNGVEWNILNDAVRGVPKNIYTNSTAAEDTASYVTALNSNGFTVSADAGVNGAGGTYVGWQWAGNGTGVTNTAGSITSTVSANTTSGFSVVTYTGTGSASDTVGHGLGVTPAMVITKSRNGSGNWMVKHQSLASNHNLLLEETLASTNVTTSFSSGGIANLSSSTTFGFLNGTAGTPNNANTSGRTYVAYCFSEVAGFSKFGSYTGNGSTDGTFVYTGFKPKFILGKTSSHIDNWWIMDTARGTINVIGNYLSPDRSAAESTFNSMDIVSNGFKFRTDNAFVNGSGYTYIYMAFAEFPFRYSLAR